MWFVFRGPPELRWVPLAGPFFGCSICARVAVPGRLVALTFGVAVKYVVHTDGSCFPNPGPGGWAAIVDGPDGRRVLSGGAAGTTNNRMELSAVLEALVSLPAGVDVRVVSDSQYVVRGLSKWCGSWAARGWTRGGEPVVNADLWRALVAARDRCSKFRIEHVKGHAGDPLNELADMLALRERERVPSGAPVDMWVPAAVEQLSLC